MDERDGGARREKVTSDLEAMGWRPARYMRGTEARPGPSRGGHRGLGAQSLHAGLAPGSTTHTHTLLFRPPPDGCTLLRVETLASLCNHRNGLPALPGVPAHFCPRRWRFMRWLHGEGTTERADKGGRHSHNRLC